MASLALLNYFLPILSFLLVFVVVYAILAKTGVLGSNNFIHLLISFILAVFFIIEVQLVDYVEFTSSWFVVFMFVIFVAFVLVAFVSGEKALEVFQGRVISWIVLGLVLAFFVISSAFVFNWAVNWDRLLDWAYSDWFGFVLLLVIAAVVSFVITKK